MTTLMPTDSAPGRSTITRRLLGTVTAALAVAAPLVAAGGAGAASSDDGTRVFDAQSGTVEIPAEPQRIVACGYAVLPLLQAEANLAAICEWNTDDMTASELAVYDALPKVGPARDASSINKEAIAAAEPDLIILGFPQRAAAVVDMEGLSLIAPVILHGPQTAADWRTLGEEYADAANVVGEYETTKLAYDERVAEIRATYGEALDGVVFAGVCLTCPGADGEVFREYASSYTTNTFDDLGLSFPGEPSNPQVAFGEWLSIELLADSLHEVDVIVYGVGPGGQVPADAQTLLDSAVWQSIPAVAAGNVIPVEHSDAATYRTAILALDSIEAGLAALPLLAD